VLTAHRPTDWPADFAVDVTTWARCDAECSPGTGFYYHPSRHSAGQPRVAAIGAGYALSDDGLWRPHSWDVDVDGTAVETTIDRQMYVGVTLDGVQALEFAVSNAHDHVKAVVRAQGPHSPELTALVLEARRLNAGTRTD
jgi:hypothetical protein